MVPWLETPCSYQHISLDQWVAGHSPVLPVCICRTSCISGKAWIIPNLVSYRCPAPGKRLGWKIPFGIRCSRIPFGNKEKRGTWERCPGDWEGQTSTLQIHTLSLPARTFFAEDSRRKSLPSPQLTFRNEGRRESGGIPGVRVTDPLITLRPGRKKTQQ